jgi:hypothetical protein
LRRRYSHTRTTELPLWKQAGISEEDVKSFALAGSAGAFTCSISKHITRLYVLRSPYLLGYGMFTEISPRHHWWTFWESSTLLQRWT